MMDEIREEEGISLLDIFLKVKQHLLFIIISIVACVGIMGFYSVAVQKPEYKATSSVIMNASEIGGTSGLNYSLNIIDTYEEFVQSRTVCARAEEIANVPSNTPYSVSLSNNGTLIVYITVTSYDPTVSIALANAFIEAGTDVINSDPEGSMKSLKLASPSVLDVADTASSSRHLVRNVAIGGMIGAVIACAYVFIRMLIDNTFTKEEEIEKELGLPVLAITPYINFNELDEYGNLIKKRK